MNSQSLVLDFKERHHTQADKFFGRGFCYLSMVPFLK